MRSTLLVLSLGLALTACADDPDPAPEAAPDPVAEAIAADPAFPPASPPAPGARPASLTLRGVYLESMYDGAAMLVDHEAIPDRMPAMQMPMRVKIPGLLETLAEGTPIEMTVDSASLSVISITELPEGTVLDLAPDDAEGGDIVRSE